MDQVAQEQKSDPPVAITSLFTAFLTVSLCGFGGGLAWARPSRLLKNLLAATRMDRIR
jgi:hypothetical protein